MKETMYSIIKSWVNKEGNVNSTEELLNWVRDLNNRIKVSINKDKLENSGFWYYDDYLSAIVNKNNSFFSIRGIQKTYNKQILIEQPIIIQNEIGYLGIICKEINGVINFLMQAKIEPGNINKIQISPTIQATKSNFTQKHGGRKPDYFDYFVDLYKYQVIVDQIQSEQSSRFYKKRNRNIIIRVDEEIEILPNFKWMTLGQIKQLMKYDNLVNMDTRTVISCIPFCMYFYNYNEIIQLEKIFNENSLLKSIVFGDEVNHIPDIYRHINNYKMFDESDIEFVRLDNLSGWRMNGNEFVCENEFPFKIIFCDIAIEGREIQCWTQPLLEAHGIATFGLMMYEDNGVAKFIVKAKSEVGCFDKIELGPTIQKEATDKKEMNDVVEELFWNKVDNNHGIVFDNLLSEEGGRFYHEQNRNIILKVDLRDISNLPRGYFAVDFKTINTLIQINNTVNIQLRNLISLLEA